MRHLALLVASIAIAGCTAKQQAGTVPKETSDGWTQLFDGKSLSGWKASENASSVRVENGTIVVQGKRSHLYYLGKDGNAEFKNFEFKADVMTAPGANSGIYFHTRYLEQGWPNKGYEAQVNNTQKDWRKTGSLYRVKDVRQSPAKDNEWFKYHIIVRGKRIVLKINGQTTVDYTEPADLNRPKRQLSSGTFALQCHDPNSRVLFKNIRVKRLPAE